MTDTQQLTEDMLGLKNQQAGIAVSCATMASKLGRMDRELFGNGRPGLVIQMAKMQQSVKLLLWLASTIGGGSLVALVGIFLKLAPG